MDGNSCNKSPTVALPVTAIGCWLTVTTGLAVSVSTRRKREPVTTMPSSVCVASPPVAVAQTPALPHLPTAPATTRWRACSVTAAWSCRWCGRTATATSACSAPAWYDRQNDGQHTSVPAYSGAGRRRWRGMLQPTTGRGRGADTQTTCDTGDRTAAQQRLLSERKWVSHWMRPCAPVSAVGHNVPVRRRCVLSHLATAHAENSMFCN